MAGAHKPASGAERRGLREALQLFLDRRILVMIGLGFSAGLPFLLVFDTLSAWLREADLSLATIGIFSLTTIFSSLKFLWAPLVDRAKVPLLTARFGHRRSWMLVAQGAIILGLWLIAGSNPAENLMLVALFAVLTGFSSATQDIVIDAWRIEAAEEERQGAMAAAYQWGYRIAFVVAGAAPLVIAPYYGWAAAYTAMAAMMAVGVASVLFAPRELAHTIRHIPLDGIPQRPWLERGELLVRLLFLVIGALVLGSGLSGRADPFLLMARPFLGIESAAAFSTAFATMPGAIAYQIGFILAGFAIIAMAAWPIPRVPTRPGAFLFHAFGDPLRDFVARHRTTAGFILALICVYRLSESVLNIMNPFYLDAGFSLIEIAEVRKVFGVIATMLGVTAGGFAIARWGLMPALIIGGLAQPISNAGFVWVAMQGHEISALFIAIGLDNVASGFAGTCLIAYMSSLTSIGFTATQYALFSSLYSLLGKFIASQSGRIVEASARAAEAGGMFSTLRGLVAGMTEGAYAKGAEQLGVSAAALGSGYIVFFIYSGLIGTAGIVLAVVIAAKEGASEEAGVSAPSQT